MKQWEPSATCHLGGGGAGFVAPEVIGGGAHSAALDMFAVGVMLFITITGRRPMTNRQANTLTYSTLEAWEYPHMHVRSPPC